MRILIRVCHLLSRYTGLIIRNIGTGTIGHRCLNATFLLGHMRIGGFSFADDRGDLITLLFHFGFAISSLYVAHDGIDALLESGAFSISIFHRGDDLISLHIQRAFGVSIARRSLHAFSCFDREIRGVGTILIRYAELIRIDATRGDGIAEDIRIRRSAFAISRRTCLGERGPFAILRGHGGVTCGVGDLSACCIGDGILCFVYDILCIVCDGANGCIGNSIRFHLSGRRFCPIFRSDIITNLISPLIDGAGAVVIGHRCLFSSYRLCIGQR